MIKYRFFGYKDELLVKVLAEYGDRETVFIYPTEKAKKFSLELFQQNWTFRNNYFYTMEEFKEQLFITDIPVLKEDKRVIALYNSLSNKHKQELNISNYFRFIGFAGNFFSFWEEFADELIPLDKPITELITDQELLSWQSDLFSLMQDILTSYRDYLHNKGFTDSIFVTEEIKGDKFFTEKGYAYLKSLFSANISKQFVFVNQHYYSKLENRILELLDGSEEERNEVIVCYQLPEENVNKKNLLIPNVPPYRVQDDYKTKKIHLKVDSNDFSSLTSLLQELNNQEITLIERTLSYSAYSRYLSPQPFQGRDTELFVNSSLYRFFQSVVSILDELIEDKTDTITNFLLPVRTLMKIFSDRSFFIYFNNTNQEQDLVLNHIHSLLQNDFFYVDLCQPEKSISQEQQCLIDMIASLSLFVKNLLEVETLSDFISVIGKERGIVIERLITDTEQSSDITALFYNSLANFSALDELQLIEEHTFSNCGKYPICSILKLFMQALKPKRYTFRYENIDRRIDRSSLLDSRNMSYKNVALLNVTEGVLPSNRITPFLLTETQRRSLGLKTYEDIRQRERYYFFRTVLNSENVWLFSQESEENNTEISSFAEELLQNFPHIPTYSTSANRDIVSRLPHLKPLPGSYKSDIVSCYRDILNLDKTYSVNREAAKESAFFILLLDRDSDLTDNTMTISSTGYQSLSDSPFAFYLRHIARIDEDSGDIPLSEKLIGTIAHKIFEKLWMELSAEELSNGIGKAVIERGCRSALKADSRYYKIPKTYNKKFFDMIVLPMIKENILLFFEQNKEIVDGRETRFLTELKSKKVQLELDEKLAFNVNLTGTIDLIINNYDSDYLIARHLFDYKTGKIDDKKYSIQLLIYELLVSLENRAKGVDNDVIDAQGGDKYQHIISQLDEATNSYLYSLIDGSQKSLPAFCGRNKTKQDMLSDFLESLNELLTTIDTIGFSYGKAKSGNKLHHQIIRTDLIRKNQIQGKQYEMN